MKSSSGIFDLINGTALLLVALAILYPLLHVVAMSLSSSAHILSNDVGVWPRGLTTRAYAHILQNEQIGRSFLNSVLYTVVGVFTNVLMTLVMAYPLSRGQLFCRNAVIRLVTFTMLFQGGMIPTFLVVKATGLLDTMWALVLPNAIWTMELLIMISFFRSLPESLFESAKIDGASEYRMLFQIAIPLSTAAIASIGMFYFIGHWNSYLIPTLYLNDAKKFPLQLVLRAMLLEDSGNTSLSMETAALTPLAVKNAVIVVSMVPVMLIYPFAQRHFVKGVMLGSVKG